MIRVQERFYLVDIYKALPPIKENRMFRLLEMTEDVESFPAEFFRSQRKPNFPIISTTMALPLSLLEREFKNFQHSAQTSNRPLVHYFREGIIDCFCTTAGTSFHK